MQRAIFSGPISMLTPRAASVSAAPDRDDSARLPCLAILESAAGGDDRGRRRNIVAARAVASGADDVDGVIGRVDLQHLAAHDLDGAGYFVHGLAAHPQAHEKGADLRRGGRARHDDGEGGPRFLAAERLAMRHLGNERLEVGHQTAPAMARKLCNNLVAVLGGDALGMELHPVHPPLPVLDRP